MYAPLPSRRLTLATLLALLPLAPLADSPKPLPTAPPATLDELQRHLRNHLDQPRFRPATWGVKILSLDTGLTLFEHNPEKLLKPASTAKLFSGALALARLGPEARIRTSVYALQPPDSQGTIAGDLVLYGRGDPSFAARFHGGDASRSLERLIRAIVQAGIREVRGDLVGDETFFRGPRLGSSWTWDDLQYYYGAEVSALSHEDNVVDLLLAAGPRVGDPCSFILEPATDFLTFVNRTTTLAAEGSADIRLRRTPGSTVVHVTGTLPLGRTNHAEAIPVPDPALWFVTRLQAELDRAGVRIAGQPRTRQTLQTDADLPDRSRWIELAATESFPMSNLVARMMKPSQNLYAQLLLLQVGARATGRAPTTTEAAGLEQLRSFLKESAIDPDEVQFDEGSGLSRRSLVTANAMVGLLEVMARHPHAAHFLNALPVAGVDGSLRQRLKGTRAEGNARAKTGTLAFVNTLAGYVTTLAGERLAFALLLNAYEPPPGAPPAREDLDTIVRLLAQFPARTAPSPAQPPATRSAPSPPALAN